MNSALHPVQRRLLILPLCHLQRLYLGLRRAPAPSKLFVNTSHEEGAAKWVCIGHDGVSAAVDLGDVPGPCGSKHLHLLPSGKQQPEVPLPPPPHPHPAFSSL